MVRGQDCSDEEGKEEEEEEEEDEEDTLALVWVPVLLLLMTPRRFSLPWFACRCLGVVDSSGRRLPDLVSYSASLGSTVDTCMALVGVFLRPLVPGSYLFDAGFA